MYIIIKSQIPMNFIFRTHKVIMFIIISLSIRERITIVICHTFHSRTFASCLVVLKNVLFVFTICVIYNFFIMNKKTRSGAEKKKIKRMAELKVISNDPKQKKLSFTLSQTVSIFVIILF